MQGLNINITLNTGKTTIAESGKIIFKLKNKKKNLQLIQESLQEFVDNNIVIDSFELKNGVFIINFLPLSEAEIQDLNFDKTKMIDNAH